MLVEFRHGMTDGASYGSAGHAAVVHVKIWWVRDNAEMVWSDDAGKHSAQHGKV